jgi:Ner family transcriptional regulator
VGVQPSSDPGPPLKTDWHPADVLAALWKRGYTFKALSIKHGYHPTAACKALKRPWPAMQEIIAEAIGVPPEMIWPSRYIGGHRQAVRLKKPGTAARGR